MKTLAWILVMLIGLFIIVDEPGDLKWILVIAVCILAYCIGFSLTEWGPFTQLPSGRRLDQKVGKNNIVNCWLNQDGYSIDKNGNIEKDPDNKYMKELRKNFFFRYFGMVYTGIPFLPLPGFGGVAGSYVEETELDFSENPDGTVVPKVKHLPRKYYTAPPIFIKRAVVLGGIPISGFNLVKFAFSFTARVTNVKDFNYRLGDSQDMVKGNFESMIRPEVAEKTLKQVLALQSEKGGTTSVSFIQGIVDATNINLKTLGYGSEIHEINLPYVEPMGEYAKAERQQAINEAERLADEPSVQKDVNRKTKVGMAEAAVRKALADATNPWTSFEKALGAVQPGATVVIGNGVMNSLPLGDNSVRRSNKKDDRQ